MSSKWMEMLIKIKIHTILYLIKIILILGLNIVYTYIIHSVHIHYHKWFSLYFSAITYNFQIMYL